MLCAPSSQNTSPESCYSTVRRFERLLHLLKEFQAPAQYLTILAWPSKLVCNLSNLETSNLETSNLVRLKPLMGERRAVKNAPEIGQSDDCFSYTFDYEDLYSVSGARLS